MNAKPECSALLKMRSHLIETIIYSADEIEKIDNILKGRKQGAAGAIPCE